MIELSLMQYAKRTDWETPMDRVSASKHRPAQYKGPQNEVDWQKRYFFSGI